MATVSKKSANRNQAPIAPMHATLDVFAGSEFPAEYRQSQSSGQTQAPAPLDQQQLAAALWHALGKVAGKEGNRDDLAAGSNYAVNLSVAGTIDGQPVSQAVEATLTVGHDSTRASSATPNLPLLIGNILALLNSATRESILRRLPEVFAENNCEFPAVAAGIENAAAAMLEKIRAKKEQAVKGSVSVKYALKASA